MKIHTMLAPANATTAPKEGRHREECGGEAYHGYAAESGAGGVERGGFPATAHASYARVLFLPMTAFC